MLPSDDSASFIILAISVETSRDRLVGDAFVFDLATPERV